MNLTSCNLVASTQDCRVGRGGARRLKWFLWRRSIPNDLPFREASTRRNNPRKSLTYYTAAYQLPLATIRDDSMALIDELFRFCNSLGDDWVALFAAHGLAIRQSSPATLANELLNQSLHVDRGIPGFEDFADDIAHAITPRLPAHSLLYHALASPNVSVGRNGATLTGFPSLDQIEIVENYVFGSRPKC
jgi:hypothetical protein